MGKEAQEFMGGTMGEPIVLSLQEQSTNLLQAILNNNVGSKLSRELATGILQVFNAEATSIFKGHTDIQTETPSLDAGIDISDIVNQDKEEQNHE